MNLTHSFSFALPAFFESSQLMTDYAGPLVPIFLMLFALLGAICVFSVGIVMALMFACCLAVLVAVGITSAAVVVGAIKRRVSAGVNAFHYLFITAISWPAAVCLCLLLRSKFPVAFSTMELCVLGTIAGVLGGVLLAFYLKLAARIIIRHFFPPDTH